MHYQLCMLFVCRCVEERGTRKKNVYLERQQAAQIPPCIYSSRFLFPIVVLTTHLQCYYSMSAFSLLRVYFAWFRIVEKRFGSPGDTYRIERVSYDRRHDSTVASSHKIHHWRDLLLLLLTRPSSGMLLV